MNELINRFLQYIHHSSMSAYQCQAFQDYQQQRYDQLQEDIKQYSKDIASLEEDTDKMEQLAKTQKELQEQLEGQIQEKESAIQKIEEEIKALEQKIQEKQEEIDAWDEQIKSRMQNEQSSTGTNMLIDLVMGSQDLNDMLLLSSGKLRWIFLFNTAHFNHLQHFFNHSIYIFFRCLS